MKDDFRYHKRDPIVDFIIVGAQKCATTSLYHILKQHPNLAASKIKEPRFFLGENAYRIRVKSTEEYEMLFNKKEGQLAFEATPEYTRSRDFNVAGKIFEYNRAMKIIYCVRNPVERIISQHHFLYKKRFINSRNKNINRYISKGRDPIARSQYYNQIEPYIEKFGHDNVLIIFFEDFAQRPSEVISRVCNFLKIDCPDNSIDYRLKLNTREHNQIPHNWDKRYIRNLLSLVKSISSNLYVWLIKNVLQPKQLSGADSIINQETMAKLRQELLPDITNLEKLTKCDLTLWKRALGSN